MLRKQSPREKYFKNQNSLTCFCLSLFLESSGQISRQSVKTTYPINSFKVDILCQNSSASKGLQEKQASTGDYGTSLGGEPIEHQDPMASTTIAQNFAEKSIALQTRFRLRCCDRARWGKWREQNVKINQENGEKPRLTKPEARQRRVCQTVHSSEECTDNRDEIYWVGCSF